MTSTFKEKPCPICGSTNFVWGAMPHNPRFVPDDQPLLDKVFNFEEKIVRARLCESCGNIQLFNTKDNRRSDFL